jgi:hypothetical protein
MAVLLVTLFNSHPSCIALLLASLLLNTNRKGILSNRAKGHPLLPLRGGETYHKVTTAQQAVQCLQHKRYIDRAK